MERNVLFQPSKRFSINLNGSASRTLNDDWSSYRVIPASPIVNDITEKEWKTDGEHHRHQEVRGLIR